MNTTMPKTYNKPERSLRDFKEKRCFVRMQIDTEAVLRVPATSEAIKARCIELSTDSLVIEAPRQFHDGEEIEINFIQQNLNTHRFNAKIQVIRDSEQKILGCFTTAAKIISIT